MIFIYNSLKDLIGFFVNPFLDFLSENGLDDKIIKLGFGNIEWFNLTLYELTNIVLSFIVIILFVLIVYRLLKLVLNIISGGYL